MLKTSQSYESTGFFSRLPICIIQKQFKRELNLFVVSQLHWFLMKEKFHHEATKQTKVWTCGQVEI